MNRILQEWAMKNGLLLKENKEVFFVDEKLLMKPDYIINNKMYVDLVDENEITSKYLDFCALFSISFGTIIVMPKTILDNFNELTKHDIEERFKIKL